MSTREALIQRPDIPDEFVDDIISIAAKMQDDDTAGPTASADEIAAVAAELDIDPGYVEQAIHKWREDARLREAAGQAAHARGLQRRRLAKIATGIVAVLGIIALFGSAARISSAHTVRAQSIQQLDLVLERQVALAPQLAALGGGSASVVAALAKKVGDGSDIETRLSLSAELGAALAGQINAEGDPSLLLNLQHELTGTQNRISAESRRFRAADAAYADAKSGLLGGTLVSLGLAP